MRDVNFSLKDLFESEEAKALAFFDLGKENQLNDKGRAEFVDFFYTEGNASKVDFLAKVVKAYQKATKKK